MAVPAYFRHSSSLEHDTGAHPECAARIPAIERELAHHAWFGFECVEAPAVGDDALLAVHPAAHVEAVAALSARGGGQIDPDTVVSARSYEAALHAAGGAAAMVDRLLAADGFAAGFCGLRPPGHHAEPDRAMGFCLFNNVAVAARRALDAHGCERVLIVDWDVHHGNGTEAVFAGTDAVLFASIHQWPLYPGTGRASDEGHGRGEGYTLNLPVESGSGDECYASLVEHVIVPVALDYAPQAVLVSAGYDAHRADPLAGCRVTEAGFAAMAGSLRRLCGRLDIPLGLVLEGGYELGALSRSVAATLKAVGAAEPPSDEGTAIHPRAAAAGARIGGRWPRLAGLKA